ncbi:Hint domain-containing protein [Rhizobium lusitanum]|uniref:Hint domain-containing protein n=1 Tax=Rhizobium lusitanum TaxID=293958 RepID=UPI002572579C|nr:Hint domain-containing protein [Rhizobium lusitanum]
MIASSTLIIDNIDVNLTNIIGGGVLSNTVIQLVNAGNVTVNPSLLTLGVGSVITYQIGFNSTLTINSGLLSVGLLQATTVDFANSGGGGHFIFTPPVIGLSVSGPPTVTNVRIGDRITVVGSTSIGQSGNVISFYAPALLGLPVHLISYMIPEGVQYLYRPGDETLTFTSNCFLQGTRIATPTGEVLVDSLREGDEVLTLENVAAPVKWIGRRTIDPKMVDKPRNHLPVRIIAGALGDNVPHRDLFVSPDHCIYVADTLIPAKLLINGTTISQILTLQPVTYFHIELEAHDIVWAEGAPAETYLDLGNRHTFLEPGVLLFTSPARKHASSRYPIAYEGLAIDQARMFVESRGQALGIAEEETTAA